MNEMLNQLMKHKIIAILRGINNEHADQTAQALIAGGISFMEITMNTDGAAQMIERWQNKFGKQAHIGAGTVTNLKRAKEAVAAGAQFLISPNVDEAVIDYGRQHGLSVWPGAMTPTEIVKAYEAGADAVKLFPMASLGLGYMKEIKAPLDHIPIIATGGVDLHNIAEYFGAGAVAVGMGSKLVNMEWVREGKYELIIEKAKQFKQAVSKL